MVPATPLHVEADETFATGEPVLAVVERASGAVLALTAASVRDETS